MSLKEDLGQLLVTLSPRTRLRLEKKCLIDTHPLQLFAVLSDATATAAVRQLAGVLLAKQIPSYWSIGPVSERLKLQNGLLVALDSLDCDGAVIRSLVDCTACLANCLAIDGVAWQDLFLWMRGIASETRLTNGVGTHCGHNHCSSFSSTSPAAPAGYSQSCLQSSQSIRKRRAFLYLLDRLLESAPWKDFLEPHVMELSELLYRMAMLARTKGDGISDGMQEDEFACSKHALESLGSLASVVRGEDDAQVFHYRIVQVLLSHEIIGSELCESALEALSRAAAADELLIADTSFYNPALAPEELCPVVRLGLSASVTQRGQRRNLALRLLHSIADSHSRLLCTSRGGQLSADEVLRILIEDVAPDEVRLKSFDSDGPFPVEAASAAEWGAEYALLAQISKRMPDKLILPVIYRFACRSLSGTDVPVKLAAFAALRAVLVGCMASVKKQLQRIARLVLRALMDSQLHAVTFVLIADLCGLIPAETRCGSCRLAERLLPPLLQQLQTLQLRDAVFPHALGALEAACPRTAPGLGKGRTVRTGLFPASTAPFRPQSGVAAIAWTGQKLEELLTHFSRETSPDVWDGIATRLCALLTALVQRQPARRSGDKTLKGLGSKIAIVLHRILVATNVSSESRSMALEAAGAWIKISADMGLKCQELQDLFNISLHAAEGGLQGLHSEQNVAADAALRFLVLLGPLAPSPGAAFAAGLEQCAGTPSPALLQALASLASTQGLLLGMPEGTRLATLLTTFLEQPHLCGPAADLVRHLPLSEAMGVLLVRIATLLDQEERPDVFCSLCMAAAHVAAQEGEPQGELSEALQLLRTVVERLQHKRSMRSRGGLPENSDQESTDVSECESSGSERSAPTVASTADLEGAGVDRALHTLCQTLGLAQ